MDGEFVRLSRMKQFAQIHQLTGLAMFRGVEGEPAAPTCAFFRVVGAILIGWWGIWDGWIN